MAPLQEKTMGVSLEVRFKSRGRSGREWSVRFEMGSVMENALAASRYAWKHNAAILPD
jgi:hypothetical protein